MLKHLLSVYDAERIKLESELSGLQKEMIEMESQTADISREIDNLKQYAEVQELNRQIVTSLIQSIHVSEPRKVDGEKFYDIKIRYKFQNPRKGLSGETKKEDSPCANEESLEDENCGLS